MAKYKPTPEQFEKQNNYAYKLADRFTNAIYEFAEEYRDATPTAILGATNVVCVNAIIQNSTNRKVAEDALEQVIKVMRNILDHTPDMFFGGQNPLPDGFSDLSKFQS